MRGASEPPRRAAGLWRRAWPVLLMLLGAPAAWGDEEADLKRLKMAYLFNFIQFVEWPSSAWNGPQLRLCVEGSDPYGTTLDALAGRTVLGRTIEIVRQRGGAAGCHVLLVDDANDPEAVSRLRQHAQDPMLTVGTRRGIGVPHQMLAFVQRGDRLVWEVNLRAMQRAGLKPSSKLLEISSRVHGAETMLLETFR